MPQLLGISHIDLTVSDCDRSATWWQDVMGFTLVNRVSQQTYECRSLIHPSGVAVTVMTHDGTAEAGPFDERRVGLDHLAFHITDPDELRHWVTHLDELGVPHSGIIDTGHGPTIVFRDPDNIQLECYVHPNPVDMTLTDADSAEAQKLLRGATHPAVAEVQ
jgi:glyoxylase I family protein